MVARGARELLRADACQIYRLDVEADELAAGRARTPPARRPRARARAVTGLVLDLMDGRWQRPRRAAGRPGAVARHRRARAAGAAAGRPRRAARGALLPRPRPPVHRGGRRAARRGRRPDRRRAEEGRADRAPDRREHRQGHVRRARRGLGRGRRRRRRARPGCELSLPAPVPARRARAGGGRPLAAWPELRAGSRRGCGASSRAPSSTPATTGCAPWCPSDARATAVAEALREACEPLAGEEGLVVGLSDLDRGAASARRRMREAADAARIGRSLVADGGAVCYQQLGAYRYLVHLEPTRRRATATASRSSRWPTTTAAAGPPGRDPRAVSSPTAAASPPAPGRCTCIRTPSASGSSGSSASPTSTWPSEDLLSLELALKLARLHRVRAEAE